jgi:hypothetical protein
MSTQFRPLEIPPGVVATATKKMRSSNWAEVNLCRWVEGQLAPVGGQAQYAYPAFASRCRKVHGWYGLDGIHYIAYLCETNIYVDIGGVLTDITPVDGMIAPLPVGEGGYSDGVYSAGAIFAATAGFAAGSVDIPVTTDLGLIWPGMSVFDMTIGPADDPPLVGMVAAFDGTTVTLAAGAAIDSAGAGDALMFSAYSEPRPSSLIPIDRLPNAWSLANFGQVLLAMTSPDGRLLEWDPSGGGTGVAPAAMTEVTSDDTGTGVAPRGRLFVVTQERFVVIFGMVDDGTLGQGSFRRFGWCDQENYHAWDFSNVTSQAGFLDIEPASPIVAAIATRNGTVFFTAHKAYVSNFLGIPYVYNYVELGANCTPWSPESIITTSEMVVWFSQQGLFSYDGTSMLPVACKVRAWIDDDIDLVNVREQACMVHVGNFNEIWWFFPQLGQPYNTRCVIYCYKEGWWSQGRMSRSAGITASFTAQTIMADGVVAYEHELGQFYNGAQLPFAETFDLNLTNGARLITVKQMMPDVEGGVDNLRYSLFYRNSRSTGAPELQTAPRPVRDDGFVDFRTTGRDIRLKIEVTASPVLPWTVGQHLVDSVVRGDR